MKRIKKNVKMIYAIVIMCCLFSSAVFGDAYSDWKYLCSLNGITYQGQSFVYAGATPSGSGGAHASTMTKSSQSVGAGRLGAVARLYKSSGALVLSTTASFTSSSASSHRATTSVYNGHGTYYSKGISYVYNGNGYNTYDLYMSPYQTASYIPVTVNSSGDIYGSEYFLGMEGLEPDLILAEGVNGIEGYIKRADLEINVNTLAEAYNYDSSSFSVPVYDSEGETIVDTFYVIESIVD